MRGLRLRRLCVGFTCRYNPACAGTTLRLLPFLPQPTIQPRVCGDYKGLFLAVLLRFDTTPRVRGLLEEAVAVFQCLRYNPACAGTTCVDSLINKLYPIQPRVCGDYLALRLSLFPTVDTTPRVRGLPYPLSFCSFSLRYNPACAGTTEGPYAGYFSREIQPRVCGDYLVAMVALSDTDDTTPRVRGLLSFSRLCSFSHRYNPACAGTTPSAFLIIEPLSIQPRVCGDYRYVDFRYIDNLDTTPRVRGLRIVKAINNQSFRYNPACAGTTLIVEINRTVFKIQPRVCGDYDRKFLSHRISSDTTPRVRGLQILRLTYYIIHRYNPACAGTTPATA